MKTMRHLKKIKEIRLDIDGDTQTLDRSFEPQQYVKELHQKRKSIKARVTSSLLVLRLVKNDSKLELQNYLAKLINYVVLLII